VDKQTIRLLEGIGYVAAVIVAAGALLREWVPNLQWLGMMLLGIVITRLVAVSAAGSATTTSSETPKPEKPEKDEEDSPEQ